ncbi:MAG: TPR end-of-group domain-containing protein [Acidimicrobiia bacterium]
MGRLRSGRRRVAEDGAGTRSARDRLTGSYALARYYATSGNARLAIEQLSLAISRQPRQWKFEAANDPAFEKIRTTAEFQKLIK